MFVNLNDISHEAITNYGFIPFGYIDYEVLNMLTKDSPIIDTTGFTGIAPKFESDWIVTESVSTNCKLIFKTNRKFRTDKYNPYISFSKFNSFIKEHKYWKFRIILCK